MKYVQSCRSAVFIVNFEHISHLVLLFLLLTLSREVPTGLILNNLNRFPSSNHPEKVLCKWVVHLHCFFLLSNEYCCNFAHQKKHSSCIETLFDASLLDRKFLHASVAAVFLDLIKQQKAEFVCFLDPCLGAT